MSISKSALIARLNRRLRNEGEMLRIARNERSRLELGDFYVIDLGKNSVSRKHVDLLDLADDIGLRLLPHEREIRAA